MNCYNLASEVLAATNVEQRIEKRVNFTTVVSRTSSRKNESLKLAKEFSGCRGQGVVSRKIKKLNVEILSML